MSRQRYYISKWENKIIVQIYLCESQGKQVNKHFVAEYAIQNHYNLGIWESKH